MEDASLDEFTDTSGDEPETDVEPETECGLETDVEPATPTFRWSPGGSACSACGGEVRRLWQSESGPVCTECKEW